MVKIWNGGLSFHGGLVGAAVAILLFCRKYKVRFLEITDIIAIPLGFFLMLELLIYLLFGSAVIVMTTLIPKAS